MGRTAKAAVMTRAAQAARAVATTDSDAFFTNILPALGVRMGSAGAMLRARCAAASASEASS